MLTISIARNTVLCHSKTKEVLKGVVEVHEARVFDKLGRRILPGTVSMYVAAVRDENVRRYRICAAEQEHEWSC